MTETKNTSIALEKKGIGKMFDSIAQNYDFLNHFLSLGIDKYWRRECIKKIGKRGDFPIVVDLATGTGDLSIEIAKRLKPSHIYAFDLSEKMMSIAEEKIKKLHFENIIETKIGNGEEINLPEEFCHLVSIGFGIRNFQHPEKGLLECHRILKQGGKLAIVEFSTPKNRIVSSLVRMYYNHFIPFIGKVFAHNRKAYCYLPTSIYNFPNGETFCNMMREAGFKKVSYRSLTFNMVNIYYGEK
ncbi:MAG TPA: bifunctional demethylmenaquinone methyltransferase/2-methoxy-6-polyprenyl-1,4-benzoquinol methylase UbiE [Porphyromonadaceae bacterium]|nr:bifunctional demethylmenaquinone methyltransferase/2-methoxy-6-polyprenyl-1,4-benzoquinol methylase UbiE [Porphyromonadaceae bacterium]